MIPISITFCHDYLYIDWSDKNEHSKKRINKIRDLFKVKLYTIRSETKREREREREREKRERKKRERDFKYLLTLILTGGHKWP